MNQRDLDQLLRRDEIPGGLPGDFASSIVHRLGRRERWKDVCLVLGGSTVLAFSIALAVAFRTAPPSPPALRLFQAQPSSHPFDTP